MINELIIKKYIHDYEAWVHTALKLTQYNYELFDRNLYIEIKYIFFAEIEPRMYV